MMTKTCISQIIPSQLSSSVRDFLPTSPWKVLRKLQTNIIANNLNLKSSQIVLIVKELVIWNISVLISILFAIVESPIIPQKCHNQQQKSARLKIHYEWIDPWEWSSTVKRLSQFYNRIQSHIVQPTVKIWWYSCSWTGEYTSVKLLHLNGGSSGKLSREVSLLSADKGGKISMKLTVVVRLKVSTKLAKAASGHLQQSMVINKFYSG